MNEKIKVDMYTQLYIKRLTSENLLHREFYSVLCGDLSGKRRNLKKSGDIYVSI